MTPSAASGWAPRWGLAFFGVLQALDAPGDEDAGVGDVEQIAIAPD